MSWGLPPWAEDAQLRLAAKEGVGCCFVRGCGDLCAVCPLLLGDTNLPSSSVVKGLLEVSSR